ncbi:glucokinase [Aquicoccus sp. SCR17]|nr:glucokinase [Carideicomes alvinocaridis]
MSESAPVSPPALVADIGGTNTRVALADGVTLRPGSVRRFRNADHPDLPAVLRAYLAQDPGARPGSACVAMAGPVSEGTGRLTNLDWEVTAAAIAECTGAEEVAVINDMQAQGHALAHLAPSALSPVQAGRQPGQRATRLVVGVGTGFNTAAVHEERKGTLVPPSEAGHTGLPVRSAEDLALADHLEAAHGYPSVEDLLSGRGITHVHDWVAGRETGMDSEAIMAACAAGDETARRSVGIFVRILGQVTGNMALVQLPFGGIYLIGGMARAVMPYMDEMGFAAAFRDKGRFSGFMERFPIWVVEDDYAALTGAAAHLADHI